MLTLARESRGLTQSQLAEKIGVRQGTLSKIEAGVLPASDDLLTKFAQGLDYPSELFVQSDRIYGFNATIFFHRKHENIPERIMRKLHALMNLQRMRVQRLLRGVEVESPCKFQRINSEDYRGRVDHVAQIVRSTWMLPLGPVRNITQAIEDAGGIVIRFDFETRLMDAISEWVPGFPPLFFVNSNSDITGDRLRFTLAHELGHVVMHRLPTPDMENEANLFASEFLMPAKEIKSSLRNLSIPKLAELKSHWRVSMAALAQRAHQLGTITPAQHKYLFIRLSKAGYRLREPEETDIPIEKPTLLSELVQAHINELGYSVPELSRLVILNEHEFRPHYLGTGLRLVG